MSDDYMVDGITVNWKEAKKLYDKVTGISKTIERVKEWCCQEENYEREPSISILAIITAYEESQKELEKEQYDHQVRRCAHKVDVKTLKAELETAKTTIAEWEVVHRGLLASYKAEQVKANKRITELLAVLTTDEVDRTTLVETLNAARKIILHLEPELYFETTEELYVWAEKLEEHKGE